MRFFKRKEEKKEEVKQDERSSFTFNGCTLSLLFSKDKNVKVVCGWPEYNSKEQLVTIAQDYSKLVINFFREEMLQYIIPSITNQGNRTGSQELVQTMFGMMENMLVERKKKLAEEVNSPLISPLAVFKVRG